MKKRVYGFIVAVAVLLAGCDQVTDAITTPGNGDGDFVAVTGITLAETSRVKGEAVDLNALAVVAPATATNQTIAWFVTDAGTTGVAEGAVAGGTVTPAAAGELVLTATVENGTAEGTDFRQENLVITVTDAFVQVENITWTAPAGKTAGEAFEITGAEVAPDDATHSSIVWSVAAGSAVSAEISGTTVTPATTGVLMLTATIANGTAEGTDYTQDFEITIAEAVKEEEEEVQVPEGWIAVDSAATLAKIGNPDETDYPLGGKYLQTANITITGVWTPIGDAYDTPFTGEYDGGDKGITPVTVVFTADYVGIFGYTDGAIFSNVHIGTGEMTVTDGQVGGIAFSASNTTFTNCSNAATVSGDWGAGGICYSSADTTIDRCWNTGAITSSVYDTTGGICADAVSSSIKNCYNSGSITSGSTVGGIVGYANTSEIVACYNEGTVTTIAWDDQYEARAGGIVGFVSGDEQQSVAIIACYNKGAVSSNVDKTDFFSINIGGVTGNTYNEYVAITACYSSGTLSHTGNTSGSGDIFIGGIVGEETEASSIATACYWGGTGASKGVGSSSSEAGMTQFASSAWPSTSTHTEWGTGDGSGSGKYWKSLGSWGGESSVYPKLWFED